MNKLTENSKIELSARIKLTGEAAQRVYDRQAEALKNGARISVQTAIEKLILGK